MRNIYIKESVDQFQKYLRQRLADTNFNVKSVRSGDFCLYDIYEYEIS